MKNYDRIMNTVKWICVSTRRIPYMGIRYTLWEDVSWHLMRTRVGSIVRTREFVLIPKRYLSFSWWVSVCLYATVRVDGSWSVRMLRSVRTYTRDLLISESRAFLAIIFANYLTRYLGLCHSPPRMKLSCVKTSGKPLGRKKTCWVLGHWTRV